MYIFRKIHPVDVGLRQKRLSVSIARLVLGSGVGFGITSASHAQPATVAAERTTDERIEEVLVTGEQRGRYRVDESALSKLTENLRDTPQSISMLPRDLLHDRGMMSLNDALRSVPGITLGAGEFAWQGNNPSIRGFSSRDDMYLDGMRDFGSYPRDPFNLETVEVLLGPSSILFGRGSTGGAINQVMKRPMLDALTEVSANIGTDQTLRGTADVARPVPLLGDGAAFRLNVLTHRGEVADRNGAEARRYGIAPSLSVGLGSATRWTLSYMKQASNDRPDYGLPWLDGKPAPVARDNYYGFESDYLETDADIGTARVEHTISDAISLNGQVRYARYSRRSRITEPLIMAGVPAGTPLSGVSVYRNVFIGDSDEDMLAAQLDARLDLRTGPIRHTVVAGLDVSHEGSTPTFAFGIGAPGTDLLDPTPSDLFVAVSTDPRIIADTTGETRALYVIDTLKLGDAWHATVGLRWDRFDTAYDATRFAGPPTPFNSGEAAGRESFRQIDDVVSYRAAVVYRPRADMSLYLAGSTSFNPSAQSLSFLTSGRGLGVGNINLDPEENESFEAGIKLDLYSGAALLSGAVFEITKTNARIPDPGNPGFNTLGGEQRVRGASMDLTGSVTDRLYLSAGYARLDSKVVRAAPGAATGAELANAPEHSVSVWANYRFSPRFDFGAGARYVSEQLADNTGAGKSVPSYRLFDLMGRYRVSETLTIKLNMTNLSDEYYFEQLHPWHVIPGPGFNTTLAINAAFD